MDTMRLFFALWPDAAARASLSNLQYGLHGRLTTAHNLHVTLAFLGQQPAARLPLFERILFELPQADIALHIDRIGYFTRKRIAWAGMHAVPQALIDLRMALVQALGRNEIPFDAQSAFKPHITLARDANQPEDMPFDAIDWHATQAVLVQSQLQKDGVAYRVVAMRDLGQRPPS